MWGVAGFICAGFVCVVTAALILVRANKRGTQTVQDGDHDGILVRRCQLCGVEWDDPVGLRLTCPRCSE